MRGKGIGRKIITQVVHQLMIEKFSRIYLEVETTNNSAMGLYRSIGFEQHVLYDYYSSVV
ncbi:GNAT family N-acetyltransferase [Enterococcus termitis]